MFITFEGGDGAGKTTQLDFLRSYLESEGHEVVTTREPGGTELGQEIRQLLLHGGDVSPRAEALMYAADRAHHVATKIRPALARGAVVLSDRYFDSSVAYQGAGRTLDKNDVRKLSMWATGGLLPDLTVLLDLPVTQRDGRLGETLDRIEAAGTQFHEAVRHEFRALAAADPERWLVIDATRGIDDIAEEIRNEVRVRLREAQ